MAVTTGAQYSKQKQQDTILPHADKLSEAVPMRTRPVIAQTVTYIWPTQHVHKLH